MFCIKCGKRLLSNANFCCYCGFNNQNKNILPFNQPITHKIVCSNCGANLEINNTTNKAYCSYCNTDFVIELPFGKIPNDSYKSYGNENQLQPVHEPSIKNLLMRAESFEKKEWLNSALDYYNRVLDIDVSNQTANVAVQRLEKDIANYIYEEGYEHCLWGQDKKALFKKDKLEIINEKGTIEKTYDYRSMSKLEAYYGRIVFDYPSHFVPIIIMCNTDSNRLIKFITNAQCGKYPELK